MATYHSFLTLLIIVLTPLSGLLAQARPSDITEVLSSSVLCVEQLSKAHPDVSETCLQFQTELERVYVEGEGLIEKDLHRILQALRFAADKHQSQMRYCPHLTPYIIHPIGVARDLLLLGRVRDADIIIAALLHDTVEDTETTFEEIESLFGERVAGFVREVTDDHSLSRPEQRDAQIAQAGKSSCGAAHIKLADKLYNLNDLLYRCPAEWSRVRIDQYFVWSKEVVDALPWVNAGLQKALDETFANYKPSTSVPAV